MEAHALLATLLIKILRVHLADEPIELHVPSSLQVLDAFLRHRVHERITVRMMADHVGLSMPHLTRLCRMHWHQTPHQRLLHLRLQHALLLLHNVDLRMAQVARYCGFADTQHFVRVFRKHLGLTPSQARMEASISSSRVQPAALPSAGGIVPQRCRQN
jgi:AraC-like DNA-binding protein